MQEIPETMTPDTLKNYAQIFFGYGHWDAAIWLIGLEESGANKKDEFQRRFMAWEHFTNSNGYEPTLLELEPYAEKAKIELDWKNPTWAAIHKLCSEAKFDVGALQSNNPKWGGIPSRACDSVALIEAMPFPSASTRAPWPYEQFKGIKTREECAKCYLQPRLELLITKLKELEEHGKGPKLVVLYGVNYAKNFSVRDIWMKLHSVGDWDDQNIEWHTKKGLRQHKLKFKQNGNCLSVCMAQPSYYNRRGGQDFAPEKIGKFILKQFSD